MTLNLHKVYLCVYNYYVAPEHLQTPWGVVDWRCLIVSYNLNNEHFTSLTTISLLDSLFLFADSSKAKLHQVAQYKL